MNIEILKLKDIDFLNFFLKKFDLIGNHVHDSLSHEIIS